MGCEYPGPSDKEREFSQRVHELRKNVGSLTLDNFRGDDLCALLKVLGLHKFEAGRDDVDRLEKRLAEINDPDAFLKHNDKVSKLKNK